MRVLHLLASPFWTGPMEAVVRLAEAQRALGHDVCVAIERGRGEAQAEELAAPYLDARGLTSRTGLQLDRRLRPLQWLGDVVKLRRLETDVLHVHTSHDHHLGLLGRPRGARLVRSVHTRRALRRLPSAHAYTHFARGSLEQLPPGHPSCWLPPLIDPALRPPEDRGALRARLGVSGAPVFGMVSTFKPSRRHDVGLEAFAKLLADRPDARLVLVGDGALEGALRARARSLGVDQAVTFAGYQPAEAFPHWLASLDEVWILGLGNDFAGRAAAQALAAGVRVLAVDEGGLASFADRVIDGSVESLVAAAGQGDRRATPPPPAGEVAATLLALYEELRVSEGPR